MKRSTRFQTGFTDMYMRTLAGMHARAMNIMTPWAIIWKPLKSGCFSIADNAAWSSSVCIIGATMPGTSLTTTMYTHTHQHPAPELLTVYMYRIHIEKTRVEQLCHRVVHHPLMMGWQRSCQLVSILG